MWGLNIFRKKKPRKKDKIPLPENFILVKPNKYNPKCRVLLIREGDRTKKYPFSKGLFLAKSRKIPWSDVSGFEKDENVTGVVGVYG